MLEKDTGAILYFWSAGFFRGLSFPHFITIVSLFLNSIHQVFSFFLSKGQLLHISEHPQPLRHLSLI